MGPPCCDGLLGSLWQVFVPEDMQVVHGSVEGVQHQTKWRGLLASRHKGGKVRTDRKRNISESTVLARLNAGPSLFN